MSICVRLAWGMGLCLAIGGGCDDEVEPPPKRAPSRSAEPRLDVAHTARLRADRPILISNMVFVFQAGPGECGVTLTAAEPQPTGSALLLAAFVRASSMDELAKGDVDLAGPPFLDAAGNAVSTPLAVYQPKSIRMKLTSIGQKEVHGTISGELYKFSRTVLSTRPVVVPVEGSFSAVLVVR